MLMFNCFGYKALLDGICDLNTSHVNVQLAVILLIDLLSFNLNTSHVNVQQFRI